MIMAKQFTLGSNERLKSRKLIERLFKEGKTMMIPSIKIHYLINPSATPALRFGVTVGSRNFKKAVDRNRIKRLVRESYRLQKRPLQAKVEAAGLEVNLFFYLQAKKCRHTKKHLKRQLSSFKRSTRLSPASDENILTHIILAVPCFNKAISMDHFSMAGP